jgi:hypothetical protein
MNDMEKAIQILRNQGAPPSAAYGTTAWAILFLMEIVPEMLASCKEAHLILSLFLPFELRGDVLTRVGMTNANAALEHLKTAIAKAEEATP